MMSETKMTDFRHIDHAIVAAAHTPMYVAHKFWARKPHNVVSEYIKRYSKKGDIVLDPFCGSGPTPLEAIKINRKAVGIDLNPIAIFITRMTGMPFDIKKILDEYYNIEKFCKKEIQKYYVTKCKTCGTESEIICSIWDREKVKIKEIRYFCKECDDVIHKKPDNYDGDLLKKINDTKITSWYPDDDLKYDDSQEFQEGTHVEGLTSIKNLFTNRNLLSLSIIYEKIEEIKDIEIQNILKFAFTSMVHLASNMCPDRPTRPYSSFWPVHRYWIPPIFMESNVWRLFESAVIGRQGIIKGKEDSNNQISEYIEASSFSNLQSDANILLSTQSALDLFNIPSESIDYVFTDPPYGGSIQYFELSHLWASWLRGKDKNPEYSMSYKDEVTINESQNKDFDYYHTMLRTAFQEIYRVLKKGKYLTITFHNTDIKIYNSIIKAIVLSGFDPEKTIYQPPARASAKGLLQPYGSAIGDYYIRFIKPEKEISNIKLEEIDKMRYERIVVDSIKRIIGNRGEPTPYSTIINSYENIYKELKNNGYLFSTPESIENIMKNNLNKEFILVSVTNEKGKKIGGKWWLKGVDYLDRVPITERVEQAVINVLNRKYVVTFDEVLEEIFTTFTNSLTPDANSIKEIISEFAEKTDGRWRLKSLVKNRENQHDKYVNILVELGNKLRYNVHADLKGYRSDFKTLNIPDSRIKRLQEIDVIWYDNKEILYEFEVENTTGITSAIVRGSNILNKNVKRFIVIPEERQAFFKNRIREPLIKEKLEEQGWKYVFYDELESYYNKIKRKKEFDIEEFLKLSKEPKILEQQDIKKFW